MEKYWNGLVSFLLVTEAFVDRSQVIILIAAEILVAGINIIVDLYAGVD